MSEAEQRAILYGIFSSLFLKPEESYREQAEAFIRIARAEGLAVEEFDPYSFEVEYNRLFVGPGHVPCPPYESVYRKDRPLMERGLVMGPSVPDVLRRYRLAGLQLSNGFKDLPDHVAAELEFMRYLCAKEVEEGDAMWRRMQREFLNAHIRPWYRDFLECVKKNSRLAFYSALATELMKFIDEELEAVKP